MFNAVNRRALSLYLHLSPRWHERLTVCSSRWMWDAGVSAIVWFQYPHVLFCYSLQRDWLRPTNSSRSYHLGYQLHFHPRGIEMDRQNWKTKHHDLECTRDDLWSNACEHLFPLFVYFGAVCLGYPLTCVDSSSDMTKKTNGTLIDGTQYSTAWSAIVLLSMIVFVASYATGLGNVPWQQGELFGLEGGLISTLVHHVTSLMKVNKSAALEHPCQPPPTGQGTSLLAPRICRSWPKLPLLAHLGFMPDSVS